MLTHAAPHVRTRNLALGAAAAVALASVAMGQQGKSPSPPAAPAPTITTMADDNKLKPPVPAPPRNEASDILGIVFALGLGVVAVGANMIPGRRSHQD